MDSRPSSKSNGLDPNERDVLQGTPAISEIIDQFIGFIRRQFPIFVFVVACTVSLGILYLFTTPSRYTSHAMLMIDSSKVRAQQQQQMPLGDIPLDTAQVDTQVEVLKSETIGLAVIKELRLTEDPEFVGSGGGFVGSILGVFTGMFDSGVSSEPRSENALTRRALGVYQRSRTIARVGRTYVLDIGYTSLSAARAAAIANAIADAYIVDQLESKYQATRRASTWLQDRITELRLQASAADRAVLDYKEKNNIISAGNNAGQLLGEQQLSEVNTQLGAARNTTAEAKARLDRISEIMKQDVPDAATTDTLRSDIISRLRNQYLDLSARERIWSTRYGPNHLATVNLRTQMTEMLHSITDELRRIAESYKSDYEIALAREKSMETNFASLISDTKSTNRDRLGLRELEASAQVFHTIYDNFLARYMEAIQQQSFPITEARMISSATAPTGRTSPQTFPIIVISVAFGLVLSFGLASLREAVDRVFRTTRQVEESLGTNCLAVLPFMKGEPGAARAKAPKTRGKAQETQGEVGSRDIAVSNQFLRHVVEEPLSTFAEAFRSIKVAADISGAIKDNRIIGITSTLPREGKSTVSSNLAQLIAHAGKKVILLDGDLRNPTLTRNIRRDAKQGLLEVLAGKIELQDAVFVDSVTKLDFLPAVIESRLAHTNEILASDAFKRLLDSLRQKYDYIIVDLPPVAPVVDVRATTNIMDCYVYVVEWGRTRLNVVQHELASIPELRDRLLGVVLNKANVKTLEKYEYYYGSYYHRRYYARYGYTD